MDLLTSQDLNSRILHHKAPPLLYARNGSEVKFRLLSESLSPNVCHDTTKFLHYERGTMVYSCVNSFDRRDLNTSKERR